MALNLYHSDALIYWAERGKSRVSYHQEVRLHTLYSKLTAEKTKWNTWKQDFFPEKQLREKGMHTESNRWWAEFGLHANERWPLKRLNTSVTAQHWQIRLILSTLYSKLQDRLNFLKFLETNDINIWTTRHEVFALWRSLGGSRYSSQQYLWSDIPQVCKEWKYHIWLFEGKSKSMSCILWCFPCVSFSFPTMTTCSSASQESFSTDYAFWYAFADGIADELCSSDNGWLCTFRLQWQNDDSPYLKSQNENPSHWTDDLILVL